MKKDRKPLRIGLLIDSMVLPAWAYRMIEIISQSDYADLALVVLKVPGSSPGGLGDRVRENRDILLYRLYNRFENLVCRPKPDAFEGKDLSPLLEKVDVHDLTPRSEGIWEIVGDGDSARVGEHGLDVIVRIGSPLVKGGILSAARHGVWAIHHGDNRIMRGGPTGFWEVFEQHPVTGSVLQVLDGSINDGHVLARSWTATNRFAVKNSRSKHCWKTLSLVPRALSELHRYGEEAFFSRRESDNPSLRFYDRPLRRAPGNLEFLRALFRHAARSAGTVLRNLLYREDWGLMYRLGDGLSTSFREFGKIVPPKDRFWADPHILFRDGRYYIFVEEVIRPSKKGHISLLVMKSDGSLEGPVKVLEQPWHLAYPLVFEWEGGTYMIPDSAANDTVDVYRCEDFPMRWSRCATLMKGIRAVDPTPFQYGGRWWLFANVREHPGASFSDELFLFSADSPLSDRWIPHPRNPVVSDARRARPAGRILEEGGKLFRVSQNCSRGYGYGMNIHEIVTLDREDYEERDIQSLEPKWDPAVTALHTISLAGDLTVIDARFRRRRFP